MLGIIINPKSGKSHFRRQRIYLWQLLRSRHQPFTYRVTKYAGHAIEHARELVEMGYHKILVLGGDGTLNEVVNGLMTAKISDRERQTIQLGLMPRGTGNDFGRFWGLDKNFKRSLGIFFDGKPQPLDVGCLTYYRNGEEQHRYFVNSIGFGVDPLTCLYAEKLKPYIGSHHVNYVFGLLFALGKQKTIPVSLSVDGKEVTKDALFTMNIGNGPFSGGGIRQNPTADPRDGILNGMFVSKPSIKQLCQALPNLFNGHLTDNPFIRTIEGHEVGVTLTHPRKEGGFLVETDGILMPFSGSCTIYCIHHALQFVAAKDF